MGLLESVWIITFFFGFNEIYFSWGDSYVLVEESLKKCWDQRTSHNFEQLSERVTIPTVKITWILILTNWIFKVKTCQISSKLSTIINYIAS